MKQAILLLAIPALALAQDAAKQGEQIFNKTCSIGYCHGPKGTVGGAPRLVARGFTRAFINATVNDGVAGTAMPTFRGKLSRTEMGAVVSYVASINGLAEGTATPLPQRPLSVEAERGRVLFYDAVRGFGRCATCHEVNGVGIPVAAPIAKVPAEPQALRTLQTPRIATVTAEGESMPALIVSRGKASTIFFDLTSAPPVQRTMDSSSVAITEGSKWKHAVATGAYSDAELASIESFLRSVTAR